MATATESTTVRNSPSRQERGATLNTAAELNSIVSEALELVVPFDPTSPLPLKTLSTPVVAAIAHRPRALPGSILDGLDRFRA